jgi:hypothetical protein
VTRKRALIVGGAVAGAAVLTFWWIQRRAEQKRSTPDWSDPADPATGAAGQPSGPFPAGPDPVAAFHAVRPGTPHMQAGSRIMRHYPGTLVDDPESLVR